MSRVTIAISEVKRLLDNYNIKDVSTPLILYHLNQAQGDVAMREDCIEKSIEITLVDGTASYDFVFTEGEETKDIIKRVKSLQYPDHWNKPILPSDQEYDEIYSLNNSLPYVQYILIRNGKVNFHGVPGITDDGAIVTLQCYLFEPTQDANNNETDPVDFQTPKYFDNALPLYAASKLTPVGSDESNALLIAYEKEVSDKAGVFNHKTNYVKSPKPNW